MSIPTESKLFDYSIHYRNWHDDSDEHASVMAKQARGRLSRVLPRAPAAVLDIGCGMGFALLGLKEAGFSDVSGIDIDPQQIEACRQRGLQVECVADSISFLGERPARYDVVLLMDVLEHVPVPEQIPFLCAVRQTLKPGGRVIVQTPNALSMLASLWRYNDHTHHCSFSEYSLRFVLQNAGFGRVELETSEQLPWRPPLRLWNPRTRAQAKKWLVRKFWREVIAAELWPGFGDPDKMSFELNLFGVAYAD